MERLQGLEGRVVDLVENHLGIPDGKSTELLRKTLGEDLGADSLDMVELQMELEDEFDTDLPDDFVKEKMTVQQLIDALADYIQTVS